MEKLLSERRSTLEAELDRHHRMLAFLHRLVARKEGVMPYDVMVREAPEELIASIRKESSLATIGDDIQGAFERLARAIEPVGFGAGAPGLIWHDMVDEEHEGEIEVFVPVAERFVPPEGIDVRTLEAGTIATTVHRGPYDEVGPAYHTVTGWVQEHGRQLAGPPRERYLNDPREVGEEEILTEVDLPIS